jgi:integrase
MKKELRSPTKEPMRHGIRKRKDSYAIFISLGKDPLTGKYNYLWQTVKGTKKEAEKQRTELLHQLDTGTFIRPSKTTFAEYLERWLKDYARPNLSPRSYERYAGIIGKYLTPEMGSIPLTQLKPEHIQKHYTSIRSQGLKPQTIRFHHSVIHKSLQTAVKWGLLHRNAADGVDAPGKGHTEMQTWDDFEVRQFLDTAKDSVYYALFHTALFTGMRRSELLGLQWRDVEIQTISVRRSLHHLKDGSYIFTDPKSDKSKRTIALSPSSILVLAEHKERQQAIRTMLGETLGKDDLVFSTPQGSPLRPNTITRAWTILAAKAGVRPIRLHDARHTHASLMLKQGIHPKIVQERLGHSTISMTLDIYSHVAPGLQEAAARSFDTLVNPEREKALVEINS